MTPTHKLPSPWYADGLGNDVWLQTAHPLPPSAGLGLPYCFRSLPPSCWPPSKMAWVGEQAVLCIAGTSVEFSSSQAW